MQNKCMIIVSSKLFVTQLIPKSLDSYAAQAIARNAESLLGDTAICCSFRSCSYHVEVLDN